MTIVEEILLINNVILNKPLHIMTSYLKLPIASFFMVLLALALTTSLQAQNTDENTEKDQSVTEQHELIKYEKTYTLQKEENEDSFGSTTTGIERQSPDNVFLAQNTVSNDPSALKKAEAEASQESEFDDFYATSGTFQGGDVTFIEDADGSEGNSGMAACSSGGGLVNINY